jgi:hypothetical protein
MSQIIFILLLFIPECLFLPTVFPTLGIFMKFIGVLSIISPYTFLYLSAFRSPGRITHENHEFHMNLYPYDHTLFHPGRYCHTCKLLKVSDSLHNGG